jgi:hypothetical protein
MHLARVGSWRQPHSRYRTAAVAATRSNDRVVLASGHVRDCGA